MTKSKVLAGRIAPKSSSEFEVPVEVLSWLKEDFGHRTPGAFAFSEKVTRGMTIIDLLHQLGARFPVFGKKAFAEKQDLTEY